MLCYTFTPHTHLERLAQITPRQKPQRIFLDSTWDWNTYGIPLEELEQIIAKCRECQQHVFQILSKFPRGYSRFQFPENVWLGTSITREGEVYRVLELRQAANGNLCFASIEPLQEQIRHRFTRAELDWMIIGLETGHRKEKVVPDKAWIDELLLNARQEAIPVYVKDNVVDLFGAAYDIRQFPLATSGASSPMVVPIVGHYSGT